MTMIALFIMLAIALYGLWLYGLVYALIDTI